MRFGGSYEETIHIHRIDDKGGSVIGFGGGECTDSGIGQEVVKKKNWVKMSMTSRLLPQR